MIMVLYTRQEFSTKWPYMTFASHDMIPNGFAGTKCFRTGNASGRFSVELRFVGRIKKIIRMTRILVG